MVTERHHVRGLSVRIVNTRSDTSSEQVLARLTPAPNFMRYRDNQPSRFPKRYEWATCCISQASSGPTAPDAW